MSKHKHTDQTWIKDGLMVKSNSGRYIGYLEDLSDADAELVIACVNVCKNLENEQLNNLIQLGGLSLGMLEVLTEQRDKYKHLLEDHGPEGHNVTNQQLVDLRYKWIELKDRLTALEEIATAVEADIDAGRPLEYNVEELRTELIRARKALGILPEQEQTTTLGMEKLSV